MKVLFLVTVIFPIITFLINPLQLSIFLSMKIVIVNAFNVIYCEFMCQLDWVMLCPDYILFLNVPVRVFLDEISIWISGFSIRLPSSVWVVTIHSVESLNWTKSRGREDSSLPAILPSCHPTFLPACWAGISVFCSWTGIYTADPLVLRHFDSDWSYTTSCVEFPACWWQIMALLRLHNPWTNSS